MDKQQGGLLCSVNIVPIELNMFEFGVGKRLLRLWGWLLLCWP